MNVRTITYEEIPQFELIGFTDPSKPNIKLQKWIEEGRTQLDLCFVIEKDNQFLGRLIYGFFEEQPYDLKVWQLKMADTHHDICDIGSQLLGDSIKELASKSFKTVEYHLYSSTPETFEAYKKIFETQGFMVEQEKKNFVATQINNTNMPKRLNFKTLQDVGEQTFIEAIEIVTEGTLDRDDLNSMNEHGSKEAALIYFNMLKDIDFNPQWWQVAYDANHEFVGLVVPQKFDEDCGAINYIGVSPDKRGNGYINDLLLEGSNLIFDDNIQKIIADIDVENFPLEKSLNALGYEYKRSLVILKLNL
jgi:ribosomal protein S18 acetylase RimI-like enzyme